MSIGSIAEALNNLTEARPLYTVALDWAQALYSVQKQEIQQDRKELARKLHAACTQAAFAEATELGHLLAIEPLLSLGKHFAKELPSTLMIGAKGAGKTFTFRQLVQSKNWQEFLGKLGFSRTDTIEASIFPVLWSGNIDDKPDGEIKAVQRNALQALGMADGTLLPASQLDRTLADALREPPAYWDDFWDKLIATQFGLQSGGLPEINELLSSASAA